MNLVLGLLVACVSAEPVRLELRRIPRKPEVKGAELNLKAAAEQGCLPIALSFDHEQARGWSHEEIRYLVLLIPTTNATRAIEQAMSQSSPTKGPGEPIGVLVLLNLLPTSVDRPEQLRGYLWKNDTVRKLALGHVAIARSEDGSLRLRLWGANLSPLTEWLLRPIDEKDRSVVDVDFLRERMRLRLLGRLETFVDFRFSQYPY